MPQTMWIVIANASTAKIYAKAKGNHKLSLIKEFEHPESRKKGRELISDGSGRYKARGDKASGIYSRRTSPKKVEADHFAKELTEALEHSSRTNEFNSLVLVAPPEFQGLMKEHISSHLSAKIKETIVKDYHEATLKELQEMFS